MLDTGCVLIRRDLPKIGFTKRPDPSGDNGKTGHVCDVECTASCLPRAALLDVLKREYQLGILDWPLLFQWVLNEHIHLPWFNGNGKKSFKGWRGVQIFSDVRELELACLVLIWVRWLRKGFKYLVALQNIFGFSQLIWWIESIAH
jgi:hypothetical protein